MNIGTRLRTLRECANLTQDQVGDYIGVTKATIARYESNTIDIKRTVAIKLAKLYNVPPAYIMGWSEDSSTDNSNNHGVIGDVSGGAINIGGNQGRALTTQEQDFLRIYNSVDGKTQMKIMNFIYEIEEKQGGNF